MTVPISPAERIQLEKAASELLHEPETSPYFCPVCHAKSNRPCRRKSRRKGESDKDRVLMMMHTERRK